MTPPPYEQAPPVCWVVTDGRAGIEAQALGLAEAVARVSPLEISVKRICFRAPWRHLPRTLLGDPFECLDAASDLRELRLPDLWIGCGRTSVPLTIAAKKKSRSTFTVQVQDPHAPIRLFDMVVPPYHDNIRGDRVAAMLGAPNRVDRGRLSTLRLPAGEVLNRPRVAVLIGGSSRAFILGVEEARAIASTLRTLADGGAGLIVTTSRRTSLAATEALRAELAQSPCIFWRADNDAAQDNPYPAMLGSADHILVTEDSVNMACEAAMTGKPVHILRLRRRALGRVAKFDRFHQALRNAGAARVFNGILESWTYKPLDETARIAGEVINRWRPTQ